MSGDDLWFDEPGDELLDVEFPDGYDDGELSQTIPCSHCGEEVYEDAVQCPHCSNYITPDTSLWSGRPAWWVVLGILGVVAMVLVLMFYAL